MSDPSSAILHPAVLNNAQVHPHPSTYLSPRCVFVVCQLRHYVTHSTSVHSACSLLPSPSTATSLTTALGRRCSRRQRLPTPSLNTSSTVEGSSEELAPGTTSSNSTTGENLRSSRAETARPPGNAAPTWYVVHQSGAVGIFGYPFWGCWYLWLSVGCSEFTCSSLCTAELRCFDFDRVRSFCLCSSVLLPANAAACICCASAICTRARLHASGG